MDKEKYTERPSYPGAVLMVKIDGSKTKYLRESKKLTQLYLSTVVGVTTDTISRWENRHYQSIKLENAEKLAQALEVPFEEILKQEEVKQKEPNDWGLYDVLGNMVEWTHDYYDSLSLGGESKQIVDPKGPPRTAARTMCGGCFMYNPCWNRSAWTGGMPPEGRAITFSFRPVRTLL